MLIHCHDIRRHLMSRNDIMSHRHMISWCDIIPWCVMSVWRYLRGEYWKERTMWEGCQHWCVSLFIRCPHSTFGVVLLQVYPHVYFSIFLPQPCSVEGWRTKCDLIYSIPIVFRACVGILRGPYRPYSTLWTTIIRRVHSPCSFPRPGFWLLTSDFCLCRNSFPMRDCGPLRLN